MVGWATGGPQKYTGRTMLESHEHLNITPKEWEAFMDDFQQTLDKFKVPAGEPSNPRESQSADGAGPPMLNSARRHRTSPRRGRRVEWSGQRRGIVRLHFRARLFRRRCACDASYESVGNAGSIVVTTTDKSLRIDSVKRCEG
jgi:hypothetical protein